VPFDVIFSPCDLICSVIAAIYPSVSFINASTVSLPSLISACFSAHIAEISGFVISSGNAAQNSCPCFVVFHTSSE
jgi:hypothetical protein